MIDPLWTLRALEGISLIVGTLVAFFSLRAFRRTREPELLFLGAGFVLISFAAALAGVVYELVTHDLLTAWTVSAAFDSLGFLLILYSILGRPR